jgi:hypothetical protein
MNPAANVAIALVLCALTVSGQQPSEPRPSSTLPLRLVGVARDVAAPARSAGLIQCNYPQETRAARLFAVGDRACDVAEVREVLEEAVVIRNLLTDRLEILTLPKAGAPSAPPAYSPSRAPVETAPEATPRPLVQAISANEVTVELRREVLHRHMSNLSEVLTSALATPRYTTGGSGPRAIEGYEMSRIEAGGIVEQLGLRDGDVILDFNGRKLDDLSAVTGLLVQAEALSGAKMTVLRNGSRMTFVFSVK